MKIDPFQIAEAKRIVGVAMGEAEQTDFTFMSPLLPWKVMGYVSVTIREQDTALQCSQDRVLLEEVAFWLEAAGINYP